MTEKTAALTVTAPDQTRSIAAFSSQGSFEAAQRMAKALSASSLVPQDYRNNIPNCLIAMELASRIGVSVFAAMQNMDIIHGRPSWRAQFLIATVNGSGRFSPLRYRFVGKEGTDSWGCYAVARDRETGDECVGPTITIKMAHAEGWVQKKGSKWQTLPQLMLCYRAAAFWTRLFAPELSLGMQTSEEMADVSPRQVEIPASVVTESVHDLERDLLESDDVESEPKSETFDVEPSSERDPGEDG